MRRNATLILALLLSLSLAAPAVALPLGPFSLPGEWFTQVLAWLAADPTDVTLTSLSANGGGCLDPHGAPVAYSPTQTLDGGGCLDPHGVSVPCNPVGP